MVVVRVTGAGAADAFMDEPGGHRVQRVPENERRGRVHSSSVTVAVLGEPEEHQLCLRPDDLEITTMRGSGAGGQKRNKTESAVVVRHLPSGLMVRAESERSQSQNRASAIALLRARLWEAEKSRKAAERAQDRRAMVGSGQRGDKRRTVAYQRGNVVDHVTGRVWSIREYLRGDW